MPKVWNKRDPNTPKDAVYVGRPTKWGNPFSHLPSKHAALCKTREEAIDLYKKWVYDEKQDHVHTAAKKELKGKDLVCWCAPRPCHADILLEIANSDNDQFSNAEWDDLEGFMNSGDHNG